MTASQAPAPVRRGRMWSLATYPLRLGASRSERPSGPFARLAVVHALSSAGDAWVTVALAGSVFVSVSLHAARGKTALGLVCTVLPFLVVGPFVGPAIERIRGGRRAIVVISAVGRVVACGFMASVIHSLWLFPAAFASLVCSKTYLVARASLVPSAVERDEDLVEANAKLAVGSSVVTSAAALLGAGIYKVVGSGAVLHLNMVLFGACAVLAVRLRPSRTDRLPAWPWSTSWSTSAPWPAGPTPAAPGPAGPGGHQQGPAGGRPPGTRRWAPPGQGRAPRPLPPGGLGLAAVAMTAMRAVAGLMTALVIFAFRRDGAPLIWYGLVGVASVVGNLGGAALAPLVRNRVAEERTVPACAFIIGAAGVVATQFSQLHEWPAALMLAAAVGIGASVAKTAFDAIVQRDPPEVARSRLFARFEAVFQLGWVLAALIPTLISLSLMTGYVMVAVLCLGAGVTFVVGWRKARVGRLPAWWPIHTQPEDTPTARLPGKGPGPVDLQAPPTITGPVGTGPSSISRGPWAR